MQKRETIERQAQGQRRPVPTGRRALLPALVPLVMLSLLPAFAAPRQGEAKVASTRHVSDGLQQATPTPEAWEPEGSWSLLHGPDRDALFSGGKGRNLRTCGTEEGRPGTNGQPAALCAVHGIFDEAGGAWSGWAVGEYGLLARYQNGAWERVDDLEPRNTGSVTYHLHDLYVIAPDDVWVVGWVEGDRGCIASDGEDYCGAVLHYDGSSWTQQDRSLMGVSRCMPKLNAIDMQYHPDHGWYGWAVGDKRDCHSGGGIYLGYNYDPSKPERWRWERVPQASQHMHDVKVMQRNDVWAMGEFGIESHYYSPPASPSWSVYGKSGADDLFTVDLAEERYGWDGGVNGRMNRYLGSCHDGDIDTQCWFDNQASPVQDQQGNKMTSSVYAIDLLSRTMGWLVGAADGRKASIAHFSQGKRWYRVDIDGDPGVSLFGLHMMRPDWGFAVGDEGVILEYRAEVLAPSATPTEAVSATTTSTLEPTATPVLSATPTLTATQGLPTPASATPSPTAPTGEPSPTTDPGASPSPTPDCEDPLPPFRARVLVDPQATRVALSELLRVDLRLEVDPPYRLGVTDWRLEERGAGAPYFEFVQPPVARQPGPAQAVSYTLVASKVGGSAVFRGSATGEIACGERIANFTTVVGDSVEVTTFDASAPPRVPAYIPMLINGR